MTTEVKLTASRSLPAIPSITDDPRSHTVALQALKEIIETGVRAARDYENSFVRFSDLVALGILRLRDDAAIVDTDSSVASHTHPESDIVDGAIYARVAANEEITGIYTWNVGDGAEAIRVGLQGSRGSIRLNAGNSANPGYVAFHTAEGTRRGYIGWNTGSSRLQIVGEAGWAWEFASAPFVGANVVWHAGNDGVGSGLDADLLDGQSSAFYQDAGNLNAGTLPDARFPATLPAISGANLTNLDASDLASGSVPDARVPSSAVTQHMDDGYARNVSSPTKTGTVKTLSTSAPSGGSDGDIWYRYA